MLREQLLREGCSSSPQHTVNEALLFVICFSHSAQGTPPNQRRFCADGSPPLSVLPTQDLSWKTSLKTPLCRGSLAGLNL